MHKVKDAVQVVKEDALAWRTALKKDQPTKKTEMHLVLSNNRLSGTDYGAGTGIEQFASPLFVVSLHNTFLKTPCACLTGFFWTGGLSRGLDPLFRRLRLSIERRRGKTS